ncbi:hypothetical protein VTL71DRAFT_13253 [Oculimacula yallundae]|uniref:SET domain-containing protein n=1 Tax=Oculimacula yallundae TaxID=86028 RepID=A0ABR4CKG0_9HELO
MMSSSTKDRNYVLQDVPGKGQGLIATKQISKGTRILSEKPMIVLPENKLNMRELQTSISQQVATLDRDQKRAFLSMHNLYPYSNSAEQYIGIYHTNSLPADDGFGGIFMYACRINHACNNNAQKSWNGKIKRHTVHALREIASGEEITITYVSPLKSLKVRQEILQERFQFTCMCHLCSLPLKECQASDRRLGEIQRLDNVINDLGPEVLSESPIKVLRYFDQQVRFYLEQEREDIALAQAFVYAAKLAISNGDMARGRSFADRAAAVWKTTLGDDSTEAMEYVALAQDPSISEINQVSKNWKTTVDEVPKGLDSSDFEKWLWKRKKPKRAGRSTQAQDSAISPGRSSSEHEGYIDSRPRKLSSVQEVPGKGKGLVALVNIPKGQRILCESPILTTSNLSSITLLERDIKEKLETLSNTKQRQFHRLHNNFSDKYPLSGIVRTNALPCGIDSPIGGLYITICFINHSCLPNAHNSWNSDTNRETIHAIRTVEKGEEITISYDKGDVSSSRRSFLKDSFGFDCSCRLCVLPSAELQASDDRRRQIKLFDIAVGDSERMMSKPEESLADCHSLLQILNQEYEGSPGALLPRLYYDAFQISICHSDQARASVFAGRGFETRIICEGEDSPETQRIKSLNEKPASHSNFGVSKRWRTSKGSIPKGLDDISFEKWLWRELK